MTRTRGCRLRFLGGIVLAVAASFALPALAQTCAFGNEGRSLALPLEEKKPFGGIGSAFSKASPFPSRNFGS